LINLGHIKIVFCKKDDRGVEGMEEACPICGFTEEVLNQFSDKKVLRICGDCLQDDKMDLLLDQLFNKN
jgi:hypothetical protein